MNKIKIAISGKMCSGKTTLCNKLKYILKEKNNKNIKIFKFADLIYDIAKKGYNMKEKDRNLLIDIGDKLRSIDESVFTNYLINNVKQYDNDDDIEFIVIDDLRFFK